jgi:transcription antitermination factor NusG
MGSDWAILRCKGSSTLRLARSLSAEGYGAWTPTEIQVKRNRQNSQRTESMVAVMPTYVFVPAEHLLTMLEESEMPASLHPDFSVFRYNDRFPLIAEAELTALRHIERKAAAKASPVVFPSGQPVRSPDGPFQGLTGQVVETTKGEFTLVAFPGFNIPVKFASWKLERAA